MFTCSQKIDKYYHFVDASEKYFISSVKMKFLGIKLHFFSVKHENALIPVSVNQLLV